MVRRRRGRRGEGVRDGREREKE
jgi:hypothetical protein